jgi:hypothetical protein
MARQVGLDAANEDAAGVAGDAASLAWIRDRFVHTLASSAVGQINDLVREIRTAADGEDLVAARDAATRLGEVLVSIRPPA